MAYKSYDELIEMTVEQVAEYTLDLEENDEIAKINGLEYVEWCGNELDDYLISKNISLDEYFKVVERVEKYVELRDNA